MAVVSSLFRALHHPNRFVRETSHFTLASLSVALEGPELQHIGHQVDALLADGMSDSWSQVGGGGGGEGGGRFKRGYTGGGGRKGRARDGGREGVIKGLGLGKGRGGRERGGRFPLGIDGGRRGGEGEVRSGSWGSGTLGLRAV